MTTNHLSEKEIQQFALDKFSCRKEIAEHIDLCESCRTQAATYQLLFGEIKEQQKPDFDFDVSALVLQQLARTKTVPLWYRLTLYLLSLAVIAAFGGLIYINRVYISYFFQKYIVGAASGIPVAVIGLISAPIITILIFQCLEMYRRYQRKMEVLNFY